MKKFLLCLALIPVFLLFGAPAYNASPAIDLLAGSCVNLYSAEQPATGAFSQQFRLPAANQFQPAPTAVSFELVWAANPGAFNIQIQDADTDATGNYTTLSAPAGTVTSSPQSAGGAYVSRVELNPWRANYGRLYVNTQSANAVNLTAKVCR
jgi:hypothetical protein